MSGGTDRKWSEPADLAPAGTGVYVTHYSPHTLSVLDPVTHRVTTTVEEVGWNPRDLAVAPTGTQVYVANFGSSTVTVRETTVSVATARGTQAPPGLAPAGSPPRYGRLHRPGRCNCRRWP
jgi:YVTN family beta-propeller protein